MHYKHPVKQKAECITGNDSGGGKEYLGEDIARYPKKTKAESVAMKVEEVITLDSDSSSSSGLSAFMSRSKKVKQEEVKIMNKEEEVKYKKKGDTKKAEKEAAALNGVRMYTKQAKEAREKERDPFIMLLQNSMQQREDDRRLREQQLQIYRMDMEHVEKDRIEQEEKQELHEAEWDCCHNEMTMMFMMLGKIIAILTLLLI
eukprot:7676133-Ditylum_brightwellii.AAC.1